MTARKLIEEARAQHEAADGADGRGYPLESEFVASWTREPQLCTLLEKALEVVEAGNALHWEKIKERDSSFGALSSALHAFDAAEREVR